MHCPLLAALFSAATPAATLAQDGESRISQRADLLRGVVIPIPDSPPARRIVVTDDGVRRVAGPLSDFGKLIYSHTRGTHILRPRANRQVADGLITTALVDCDLAAYAILVSGGGDGTGDGFGVELMLLEGCPAMGGRRIARTARVVNLPDDGLFEIVVDMSNAPPTIPSTVWISATFNTNRAGWAIGVPPELGFSDDAYFHPFTGCNTFLGGFPRFPHASMHVQLFVVGECPAQHAVHRSFSPSGQAVLEGAGTTIADDVSLTSSPCELAALELNTIGFDGPFVMDVDLRFDGPGDPIAGTHRVFQGAGTGSLEIARFVFEPGLTLPERFWVSATPDSDGAGILLGGKIKLGSGQDLYAVLENDQQEAGWTFRTAGNAEANFGLTIFCRGSAPVGACCLESPSPEASPCDDSLTEVGCVGRWLEGAFCADEPFDPPCGSVPCCLPDDTCQNLTSAACEDQGGVLRAGVLCDEPDQPCPRAVCRSAGGDCLEAHQTPACSDATCCNDICREDPWCCDVAWDELCAARADLLCGSSKKTTRTSR